MKHLKYLKHTLATYAFSKTWQPARPSVSGYAAPNHRVDAVPPTSRHPRWRQQRWSTWVRPPMVRHSRAGEGRSKAPHTGEGEWWASGRCGAAVRNTGPSGEMSLYMCFPSSDGTDIRT